MLHLHPIRSIECSAMTERNDAAVERFVERLGNLAVGQGNSRTFGRIFALLMTADEPLSFSEIARRLGLSRGGVSMSTRSLVDLGLIDRIKRAGDRQDYFELTGQIWKKLYERQIQREADMRDAIVALTSHEDALPGAVRSNLQNLARAMDLSLETKRKAADSFFSERCSSEQGE